MPGGAGVSWSMLSLLEQKKYWVSEGDMTQLGTSDELESKFQRLEGDDVDDELSRMKRGLISGSGGGSAPAASKPLPEGRPIR